MIIFRAFQLKFTSDKGMRWMRFRRRKMHFFWWNLITESWVHVDLDGIVKTENLGQVINFVFLPQKKRNKKLREIFVIKQKSWKNSQNQIFRRRQAYARISTSSWSYRNFTSCVSVSLWRKERRDNLRNCELVHQLSIKDFIAWNWNFSF